MTKARNGQLLRTASYSVPHRCESALGSRSYRLGARSPWPASTAKSRVMRPGVPATRSGACSVIALRFWSYKLPLR